jgi:hypothetical protein
LLLLDIDGVLNPYGVSEPSAGYSDHHLFPGEEPVRVNPLHGAWLTEARSVLDIAWASSWNDEANTLLSPLLNMTPLPVVTMPPPPFDAGEKVPVIAAYAQQRPVAWIDDLHTPRAQRWAASRTAPTLLMTTDPTIGLTRDSIDRVIAWARDL